MTEVNEQTLPETASEPEIQSPAVPERKPVTWEAAILLALAFLAALWYGFGHNLLSGHYYGPGIGLTVSHWVLTAAVLILARVRNTLRLTPQGIFLLVLSLLLSTVYGIFANTYMKLLNLPVLLLLSAQALFTLTGHISLTPPCPARACGKASAAGSPAFSAAGHSLSAPCHGGATREKTGKSKQSRPSLASLPPSVLPSWPWSSSPARMRCLPG